MSHFNKKSVTLLKTTICIKINSLHLNSAKILSIGL